MSKELEVPVWWSDSNGMMYRRDALPPTHPESTYKWLESNGHIPEEYGVYKFLAEDDLLTMTKQELIRECLNLRGELKQVEKDLHDLERESARWV